MMNLNSKNRKYLMYGIISVLTMMLLSSSVLPMFNARSPTQDPDAVPVEVPDNPDDSILNEDPTTTSSFIIRYADGTYKVIESLSLYLGIVNLSSIYSQQSVYNGNQEITTIDMGVDMTINFRGEPTPFEVYKNIVLQIDNSDGESYEESFLIQREVITFRSGVPQKVTEISVPPDVIEEFADKATEGIIDGSYNISIHYDYAVYGKVLSGGSASMPINIDTFSASTSITGGDGSASTTTTTTDPDQSYNDYVMSYEEKLAQYGLIDYHAYQQSWLGEKDLAGNFIFVETCRNMQILNEPEDIQFHESMGGLEGVCPVGTTVDEILEGING